MKPSEVRSRVLSDHERLRRDLDRLGDLAGVIRNGHVALATLRADTEVLLARLEAHMHWEESYLLPALREADAWGVERAEQLTRDHREQRELLDYLTRSLRGRLLRWFSFRKFPAMRAMHCRELAGRKSRTLGIAPARSGVGQ